jgi:nucleotide-binding universal stress UspA family protein
MHFPFDAFNGRILVAVDGSANSRRAVAHVAAVAACAESVQIALLHIISEPDPDYFTSPAERLGWLDQRHRDADAFMAEYKQILANHGISGGRIAIIVKERDCPSLSECIMDEMRRLEASTIAIGRTGLQAKEELLLGSVSKRIVHHAKDCAVWVVT